MNNHMTVKDNVSIIEQRGNPFAAFRVVIKDVHGCGLGYGNTPQAAFEDARDDYKNYREAATFNALNEADQAFEALVEQTQAETE